MFRLSQSHHQVCLFTKTCHIAFVVVTRTTDSGTRREHKKQHTETETGEHLDNAAVHYKKRSKVIDLV
jgi:hypothetical protein